MSYKTLDHATDAFIEVTANNIEEAFRIAAQSVIDTTLDPSTIQEIEEKEISASGKDLRYLLFNWLEELVFLLITEGFAIRRVRDVRIERKGEEARMDTRFVIYASALGEPLDLSKHKFRVEIKAPTFYEMEIEEKQQEGEEAKNGKVRMKFLLDL